MTEPVSDERALALAHKICTGQLSAVQGAVEIMKYATDGVLQIERERCALIPGLTVVAKPMETYLIVREADGDRELNPAEVRRIAAVFAAPGAA